MQAENEYIYGDDDAQHWRHGSGRRERRNGEDNDKKKYKK